MHDPFSFSFLLAILKQQHCRPRSDQLSWMSVKYLLSLAPLSFSFFGDVVFKLFPFDRRSAYTHTRHQCSRFDGFFPFTLVLFLHPNIILITALFANVLQTSSNSIIRRGSASPSVLSANRGLSTWRVPPLSFELLHLPLKLNCITLFQCKHTHKRFFLFQLSTWVA